MNEIKGLTGIRGWAALWVCAFHFTYVNSSAQDFGEVFNAIAHAGHNGVTVFFILSGFIMAYVYGRVFAEGQIGYLRFMSLRLARIYPLHLALLLAVAVFVLAGVLPRGPEDTALSFFLNVLLLQSWGFINGFSWNITAWSISSELAAYLLFPLLAAPIFRRSTTWSALAIFVLCAISTTGAIGTAIASSFGPLRSDVTFAYGINLVTQLLVFFVGVCLFNIAKALPTGPRLFDFALIAGLAVLLEGVLRGDLQLWQLIAASSLLVLGTYGDAGLGRAIFGNAFSKWLGDISYSLYLVHWALMYLWIALLPRITATYWHSIPLSLRFASAILVAALLHYGLEKPARRWLRGLTATPRKWLIASPIRSS
jgi:peptidoglycan/LPS O-acetylase OafA/YrhL